MTPASFLRDLAAFWVQIAIVVAAIAVLLKVVSIPPRVRYVCLRLALLACLVVPWTLRSEIVVTPAAPASEPVAPDVLPLRAGPVETITNLPRATTTAAARLIPDIPWTTVAFVTLIGGVVARGFWLIVGLFRLRRMTGRAMPVDSPDYAAVQQQVGTAATIAQVDGLPQPVTFGFRRPMVLLPETLAAAPAPLRRAVVTHELFHVRRGDWLSVLGEEALRTMLWFHPAVLWLTSHIQLAREEMVDELTVRATGDRRAYMQALLAFADTGGLHPAPAFAHRRQLFHRILSVSKEKVMSAPRIVMSIAGLIAAVSGASWYASTLFPIARASRGEIVEFATAPTLVPRIPGVKTVLVTEPITTTVAAAQGDAAAAKPQPPRPVTPENPIPRRTRGVPPIPSLNGQVVVSARVTLDRDGRVTNVERDSCHGDVAFCREFFDVTAAAIRQWRYERPVQAPLQFYVVTTFRPGQAPAVVQSGTDWTAYVRETQDSLRALAQETGGIAIVNQRDFDQGLRSVELQQRLDDLTSLFRELERAQRLATEKLNPAQPELIKLHQKLAELYDELVRIEQQIRNTRPQQGADQLTTARDQAQVAAESLRRLELVLQEAQRPLEAARRVPEQTTTAAVSQAPTTPADRSRQLVSPSGRTPLRMNGAPPPGLQQPTPTKSVQPTYPLEAMESRLQGTVAVEVLVDERGRVADAQVLRGVSLLHQAALDTAKQWEFRPALLNGEPVPVLVVLEMHFTLK